MFSVPLNTKKENGHWHAVCMYVCMYVPLRMRLNGRQMLFIFRIKQYISQRPVPGT
jgi:hypothetical protein